MKNHVDISVDPGVVDYLSSRLQTDTGFLSERQGALNVKQKDDGATWQYLQGKRDMCKQVLLYLEEIQRLPKVAVPAARSAAAIKEDAQPEPLFRYPEDYDTNE
ncbi:MAG: hypothetical protein GY801_29550 [bacterium]|nr:hypothetical protein [bacterium]